jgi:hypothetical protein
LSSRQLLNTVAVLGPQQITLESYELLRQEPL